MIWYEGALSESFFLDPLSELVPLLKLLHRFSVEPVEKPGLLLRGRWVNRFLVLLQNLFKLRSRLDCLETARVEGAVILTPDFWRCGLAR